MVSPSQLCWRYHSLPLTQWYVPHTQQYINWLDKTSIYISLYTTQLELSLSVTNCSKAHGHGTNIKQHFSMQIYIYDFIFCHHTDFFICSNYDDVHYYIWWSFFMWKTSVIGPSKLTHWGRDKMAAIFQTTFPNGFSWMKMYDFRLTFHWSLFLRVQLTIFQHWFR